MVQNYWMYEIAVRQSGRLLRVIACACVTFAMGCGGTGPEQTTTVPRVVEDVIDVASFHKIGPDNSGKARIGSQYRRVLVKPYSVEDRTVPVSADGTINLADVIDISELSSNAEGMSVSLRQGDIAFFSFIPIAALKSGAPDALQTRLPDVLRASVKAEEPFAVHVREQVPLIDFRSAWLNTVSPARLDLGVALESAITDQPAQVSVSITVETAEDEKIVFDRILTEPLRGDRGYTWSGVSVDLTPFHGAPFRLLFRAERLQGASDQTAMLNTASLLWGNPIVQLVSAASPSELPNVLLISLDTLRADHLGAYGYERDTSPNLDRFFEEGVLFENCVSTSSWTTPSHASLFTGLSPVIHRANGLNGYRLRDSFTTLAELAENSGQLTAAFTEGVAIGGQLGFSQGFDLYSNGPSVQPAPPGSAGKTFDAAAGWLERFGHQPFFLFVHTYEIHAKYRAPEPYGKTFVPEELKGDPPYVPGIAEFISNGVPPEKRQLVIDMYDGEIRYTDEVVGTFIEKLKARGLLDNTLVILFSDHGEEFWDHGGMIHGLTLFREQLHVPLYIRFPGSDGPKGRVSQMVSLIDVFTTVNNYMNYGAGPRADSMSLLPLCDPQTYPAPYVREMAVSQVLQRQLHWLMVAAQTPEHKYIITTDYSVKHSPLFKLVDTYKDAPDALLERELLKHVLNGGRDTSRAADDEELRAILRSANERLFDSKADPKEVDDLANTAPELLQGMRERVAQRLDELAAASPVGDAPISSVSPLDEREREELRALGYLD